MGEIENRKSEEKKVKPKLDDETAHISSDYRAVWLKDSSACHLLGNLFTLHAEINTGVKYIHGKLCTM